MTQRLDTPHEPVIPRSECNAALKLAEHLYENIVSRGDAPEEIVAWAVRVAQDSATLRSELNLHPTDEDLEALGNAIVTALLPTFHHGSSQEEAGAALLSLIAVGSKYGWTTPEEGPAPNGKMQT